MRRTLFVAGAVVAALAVLSGTAQANDCANFSRTANGATPWETSRGRWFLIDTGEPDIGVIWVFGTPDNFMNGKGDALLDGATCPTARLLAQVGSGLDATKLKGIWSERCFEKAAAGLTP